MIRCNLNTRSRNSFHTFRRHRGFTFVEVMMSTLLVAVGATLALPSYRDMVDKRQLTHDIEQLASFINSVQSISTRTNQVVAVSYQRQGHDEWCIGAVIEPNIAADTEATGCNCTQTSSSASDYCAIYGQKFMLDNTDTNNLQLMHDMIGDGAYAFDPIRGLFRTLDDSFTMELHTENRKFKLNLMVNNSGRVILCSKDDSHAVPGYDLCPS